MADCWKTGCWALACRFHFGCWCANYFWGAGPIEAGGDDRDADLFVHVLVDDRTEDHVHIGVRGFADDGGGLVDLVEGQAGPPVMLKRIPRAPSMVMSSSWLEMACSAAFLARSSPLARPTAINAAPPSDMIALTSAKSRLIKTGDGDEFGDALDALAQHIICSAEGILQGGFLVRDLQQAVIGDDDEGIGVFLEAGNALFG